MSKTLGEVADALSTTALGAFDGVITGITLSSQSVARGEMFIAVPGARSHGVRYLDQALQRGAAAVLTDPEGAAQISHVNIPVVVAPDLRGRLGEFAAWFYDHPSRDLSIAAVTGTNGKTTTAYLMESIFAAAGMTTGLIGTVETKIAGKQQPSVRTTPEAPDLQRLLDQMRSASVSSVAMEVSSHALALGRVRGTHFAVAGFTNLTQDHLDFHHSMEEYFQAKAALFTPEYAAAAIINIDDPYGQRLLGQTEIPALAMSIESHADWYLSDIKSDLTGSWARVHAPDGERADMQIHLPGRYNLSNALLAIAAAVNLGLALETAIEGIARCAGVPGRMEPIDAGQSFLAVVDYAHSPDAVEHALRSLRALTSGRVISVLGCGGDRDQGKRPLMGEVAARHSDLAIFTNDNPRSEEPMAIISAMCEGADRVAGAEVIVEPDRHAAISLAVSKASAGDVVLIAGKGHEQGQEAGGVITAFDDRLVLRSAIVEAQK